LETHAILDARCRDLVNAMHAMAQRNDLGKRIGLFGSSMGGAVCLRVAGRVEIAATVTFAAPIRSRVLTTPPEQSKENPGQAQIGEVLKQDFDLGPELAGLRGILIFHGDADAVVPVAHAHEIFQRAAEPKRLVLLPGGDHLMSDPRHQTHFIKEAAAWLKRGLT
jgi:fermentation-respiration switch protein FrsA (DUF1100 family)